jgi:hypothetical protein
VLRQAGRRVAESVQLNDIHVTVRAEELRGIVESIRTVLEENHARKTGIFAWSGRE